MKYSMSTFVLFVLVCFLPLQLLADEPEVDEDGNPIVQVDEAPQWSLLDADGNTIGSEQLKGKPYVLHFWATWCPYCKRLQPGLDGISIGYVKDDITTYAVSFWENPKARPVEEMANRGLLLPVLIEGDEVAKSFGVMGTPTTLFINHKGEISHRHLDSNPNDPQIRVAYELLKDQYTERDNETPESTEEDDG